VRVLLTGGAGYVGSHAAAALAEAGHDVTILDDLSGGHARAVTDFPLIRADITDRERMAAALAEGRFDAVMHFAALTSVAESMDHPDRYYRVNVAGSLNLLEAMAAADCRRLVFSSSAAVYGAPAAIPVPEDHAKAPVNPYGQSKRDVENAIRWYASAGLLGAVSLRYFNAAGASLDGRLGEDHQPEQHLIPLVLHVALGNREDISIFGADYDTPDGTCVRDFVHVCDLARAHVLALERVTPGRAAAFNVGTGRGHSVREVIETARAVTGRPIPVRESPRRPGDPPVLVAAAAAIREALGWRPATPDLEQIVTTAWNWLRTHPDGYGD